jgi:hypothetical protein
LAIRVELDKEVRRGFFYWDRWPNQLLDAIAEVKTDIYQSLAPHPLYHDTLVAERSFKVRRHRYLVIFAVERARASQNVFRIMRIDCID